MSRVNVAMIDMKVDTAKVNRLGMTPKIKATAAAAAPTIMRTKPTLERLPLKLSLRNFSASSGMISLVLVERQDVSSL